MYAGGVQYTDTVTDICLIVLCLTRMCSSVHENALSIGSMVASHVVLPSLRVLVHRLHIKFPSADSRGACFETFGQGAVLSLYQKTRTESLLS